MDKDKRTKAEWSLEAVLYQKMKTFTNTREEAITYFRIVLKDFTEGVYKGELGTLEHVSMQKFINSCSRIFSNIEGADPGTFHDLCNFGLYFGFSEPLMEMEEKNGKSMNAVVHYKLLTDLILLLRKEGGDDYSEQVIAIFEVYRMKMAEKVPGGKREIERIIKKALNDEMKERDKMKESILNVVK